MPSVQLIKAEFFELDILFTVEPFYWPLQRKTHPKHNKLYVELSKSLVHLSCWVQNDRQVVFI